MGRVEHWCQSGSAGLSVSAPFGLHMVRGRIARRATPGAGRSVGRAAEIRDTEPQNYRASEVQLQRSVEKNGTGYHLVMRDPLVLKQLMVAIFM
jgi:hypothetical protein